MAVAVAGGYSVVGGIGHAMPVSAPRQGRLDLEGHATLRQVEIHPTVRAKLELERIPRVGIERLAYAGQIGGIAPAGMDHAIEYHFTHGGGIAHDEDVVAAVGG